MFRSVHSFFILFLLFVGSLAVLAIGIHGFDYYRTPIRDRPFHPLYDELKPTGVVGHGCGIIGTLMIIAGVTTYSGRKRIRRFSGVGKIKYFLEFHIFLCLVGPILVLYHTTFKFGGLVAVCFWSMAAVVLSGIIGRYFYMQIPKGISGNEKSMAELTRDNEHLSEMLAQQFGLSKEFVGRIDALALPQKSAAQMGLVEALNFFMMSDLTRRWKLHRIYRQLRARGSSYTLIRRLRSIANRRVILTRRIAFLEQFRTIFYYWHVIHLPFSIVMFVVLSVHVGVAVAFGYTWIW